jgi:hypothetical protein
VSTSTDKKVTRVTSREYSSRYIGPRARRIAVTILPGDTLLLRLSGTRQCEYIGIADVFEIARSKRVKSEMFQKINHKRRSKR